MKNLVFVDCEAVGGCPAVGRLTEFGAVTQERESFHGVIAKFRLIEAGEDVLERLPYEGTLEDVFTSFDIWLQEVVYGRPIFVSDNPAFDWQWINDGFWRTLGRNPFGHSARRISDFYAGLKRDFSKTQEWKHFRKTPHDHNPVHDALGNLEAFEVLLKIASGELESYLIDPSDWRWIEGE